MKINIIIVAFSLFAISLSAQIDTTQIATEDTLQVEQINQPDAKQIPFVSYWELGDQYQFRVTKDKKRWKGEELTKDEGSTYDATFTVIDSTENSYKIKWVYGTDFESDFKIPAELVEKFSKYEMNEVIYSTSETGEFLGVDNWKELADIMDSMFVEMTALYQKQDTAFVAEEFSKILKPLRDAYCSKEGIESVVLKELHYFHFPFGVAFVEGEVFEYEDLLANMFGGDPLRGEVKLYIDSVDYQNEYCELVQEMDVNKEDTKKMILDLFTKMGATGEEITTLMESSEISIKDRNRYSFYYYPGVPVKIEAYREALMNLGGDKGRNIETVKIELLFPEE